jgi:hypothetical protein
MPVGRSETLTVSDILRDIVRRPGVHLIRRWNWKSALTSSLLRGVIFFATNLTAGWRAAAGAMAAEFIYRTALSGFYGSVTQSFRHAQPAWASAVFVMVLLPLSSHVIEFVVHYLRGTPKLLLSMIASVIFTAVATLFNWYAMRQGVLVVGEGNASFGDDMKAMPRVIAEFLLAVPAALWRAVRR